MGKKMSVFVEMLKAMGSAVVKAPEVQHQYIILMQEAMAMVDENARLQAEVRELREKIARAEIVVFEKDRYYAEVKGRREGPYCSKCLDVDSKLVRLHPAADISGVGFECPNCRTMAYDTKHDGGEAYFLTASSGG